VTRPQRIVAVIVGLSILLADQAVHACPVCFRVDDDDVTSGVYAAVFVLLGVTSGVLGGFATFIVRFVRRARLRSQTESDTAL
jgi:heme/copper-type cytochrome/quinol oxidase subunit 2